MQSMPCRPRRRGPAKTYPGTPQDARRSRRCAGSRSRSRRASSSACSAPTARARARRSAASRRSCARRAAASSWTAWTSSASRIEAKRRIAVVPQTRNLDRDLTRARGARPTTAATSACRAAEREARADRLLEELQLADKAEAKPLTLSGGHAAAGHDRARPDARPARCCCSTSPPPASTRRRAALLWETLRGLHAARPHHHPDHALHGRGRPPLPAAGHRRPRRDPHPRHAGRAQAQSLPGGPDPRPVGARGAPLGAAARERCRACCAWRRSRRDRRRRRPRAPAPVRGHRRRPARPRAARGARGRRRPPPREPHRRPASRTSTSISPGRSCANDRLPRPAAPRPRGGRRATRRCS